MLLTRGKHKYWLPGATDTIPVNVTGAKGDINSLRYYYTNYNLNVDHDWGLVLKY